MPRLKLNPPKPRMIPTADDLANFVAFTNASESEARSLLQVSSCVLGSNPGD